MRWMGITAAKFAAMLITLVVPVKAGGPWYVNVATGTDSNDCLSPTVGGGGTGPCRTVFAGITKSSSGDTIYLAEGTYPTAPGINLPHSVSLIGAGQTLTVLDGGNAGRHFNVPPNMSLDLKALSLRNGRILNGGGPVGASIYNAGTLGTNDVEFRANTTDGSGAAVANQGTASLLRTAFTRNTAGDWGGAIYNTGTLSLSQSSIVRNEAEQGAGIYIFSGTVNISGSLVAYNTATDPTDGLGGGIYNRGILRLVRTTVSFNQAISGGGIFTATTAAVTLDRTGVESNLANGGSGGGIWAEGGGAEKLAVINSTISANTATSAGGGIFNNGKNIDISFSTIAANIASAGTGGNVSNQAGTIRIKGTILSGGGGGNCSGPLSSEGYNILDSTAACMIGGNATGNLLNTNPFISELRHNGGASPTHIPVPGQSPAIDAVPLADCSALGGSTALVGDESVTARPQGPNCDIGSIEVPDVGGKPYLVTANASGDMIQVWPRGRRDAFNVVYRVGLIHQSKKTFGPSPAVSVNLDGTHPPLDVYCHFLLVQDNTSAFIGGSWGQCAEPGTRAGSFVPGNYSLQINVPTSVDLRWEPDPTGVDRYVLVTFPIPSNIPVTYEYLSEGFLEKHHTNPEPHIRCFMLVAEKSGTTSNTDLLCAWPQLSIVSGAAPAIPNQDLSILRDRVAIVLRDLATHR